MITALILCAHLTAAKAVTHCHNTRGASGVTAASFSTANGPGFLLYLPDPNVYEAITAEAHDPRITYSYAPRVGILIGTRAAAPETMGRWIGLVEAQLDYLNGMKAAAAEIKEEQSNAGGVADLARLHDLGQQFADAKRLATWNEVSYKNLTGLDCPWEER